MMRRNGWRKQESRAMGSLVLRRVDGSEFLNAPVPARKVQPGMVLRSAPEGSSFEHLFVVAFQPAGTAYHIGSYDVTASPSKQVRIDPMSVRAFLSPTSLDPTGQEMVISGVPDPSSTFLATGIQTLIDRQVARIEDLLENMKGQPRDVALEVMKELAVALAMNNLRLRRSVQIMLSPSSDELTMDEWSRLRATLDQCLRTFRRLVKLSVDPTPLDRQAREGLAIIPTLRKVLDPADFQVLQQAFRSILMSHIQAMKDLELVIDARLQGMVVVGQRDPRTGRTSISKPKFFSSDIMAMPTFWPGLEHAIDLATTA